MNNTQPAIWFPTVRTGTGTDVFTERLVAGLNQRGIRAEITWLPLRAEYAPWTVVIPKPPDWATIAHVNTWMHSRFLPKNIPVIATLHHSIHDPALLPYKGWLRATYHRWWIAPNERRVMRRATKVTAVSQFVADMARKTLCDVPMQVIYNGIDTNLFRPGSRVRQPGEPFRLLYVGAWRKLKGIDLLAPIMRELGEDFELYYTGGAAAEPDKASMPNNMHDLGRLNQQQVIQQMQQADAFLFPSRSEGFGLVAAEAMACGLPVVAMQGTAVDDVLAHGVQGLLLPAEDIASASRALRQLQADSALRQHMGLAATQRVQEYFSQAAMLDGYVKLYFCLLNESFKSQNKKYVLNKVL